MSPSIKFADQATSAQAPRHSVYTRPAKKPKMSLTQTYFLAHSARGKLSKEASRADHDLRLLVGHANMLDSLMIDLANAEQEQERWFTQSVTGAAAVAEPEVEAEQDLDMIVDDKALDWEADEVDTDTEDEASDDDLSLVRIKSHSHSPPELTVDADSDSEDEHMPSSPPDDKMALALTAKQQATIANTPLFPTNQTSMSPTDAESFEEDGFFIPSRSQPILIAAN